MTKTTSRISRIKKGLILENYRNGHEYEVLSMVKKNGVRMAKLRRLSDDAISIALPETVSKHYAF